MSFSKRRIPQVLELVHRVGLGYIQVGQSATTLSRRAERVKLAKQVSTPDRRSFILDEPHRPALPYDVVAPVTGSSSRATPWS